MNEREMKKEKAMKIRHRLTRILAIGTVLLTLAALGEFPGDTHAQTRRRPRWQLAASGLVHVTTGQSVQLNVSWEPVPDDGLPIPDDGLPVPNDGRGVRLMIFDADGVLLAHTTARLRRGRSVSLTFNRDSFARTEARLGLRAVARLVPVPEDGEPIPDDGQPVLRDMIVASFEVIDNRTQQTVLISQGVIRGFNPQPEPPVPQR